MTYPATLQAYYDAHDRMMDAHRGYWPGEDIYLRRYKEARAAAVRDGLLPETPQFDVGGKGELVEAVI